MVDDLTANYGSKQLGPRPQQGGAGEARKQLAGGVAHFLGAGCSSNAEVQHVQDSLQGLEVRPREHARSERLAEHATTVEADEGAVQHKRRLGVLPPLPLHLKRKSLDL